MNKKAYIEDFMAFIVSIVAIAIIVFFVYTMVAHQVQEKQDKFQQDVKISEMSLMTRNILNYEIREGYKTYDLVVDGVNRNANNYLFREIGKIISKYYPKDDYEWWILIINNDCVAVKLDEVLAQSEVVTKVTVSGGIASTSMIKKESKICSRKNYLPKVTIPNPYGDNIMVAFFPETPILAKDVKRVPYGYRAGQIQGFDLNPAILVSHEGKPLEEIKGIPNVICEEEGSAVGRICVASPELVAKLRELSSDLVLTNRKLIITQAYRDWEIQNKLFNQNFVKYDENGKPITSPPTCYPGKSPEEPNNCPHMVAGAIDVVLCDADGKNVGFYSLDELQQFMCNYGFVRWINEDWHFEYGTQNWKNARDQGLCTYGTLTKLNKYTAETC